MQLKPYFKLMRFDKPIGTMLLLWPTLMALVLVKAELRTSIIFILGVVVMRAAGCVINDYADRNFDGRVARTKERPLAHGSVNPKQAIGLFITLMFIAVLLALQLHVYTLGLACIAAILAISYPFMKRVFGYPQFILGIAFAWSILMVFVEVMGYIPPKAWVLFIAVCFWVVAYDTQYAMADKNDDLLIGIKSTAISFGNYDKQCVLLLQILALTMFAYLNVNLFFVVAALGTVLYQQYLLMSATAFNCIRSFKNNNIFGALICLGFCL